MGSQNYELDFFVTTSDGQDIALELQSIRFDEHCSRPYQLKVVGETSGRFEMRALLGQPAMLVVNLVDANGSKVVRYVHGYVSRAKQRLVKSRTAVQRITLEVAPPIRWLKLTRDSKIFLKKTTQQIVSEVFDACGFPASEHLAFRLTETYQPREVCTQYEETCFDFVSRLLEEEGIYYYFEHGKSGLKMICADAAEHFAEHPDPEIPLIPGAGSAAAESIQRLSPFRGLRPSKVVLLDHDFRHADQTLKAEDSDDALFGIEHCEYPGRFSDQATGNRYAKARLGELRALSEGLRGDAQAFSLTPGYKFVVGGSSKLELSPMPGKKNPSSWVPVHLYHFWNRRDDGKLNCKTTFTAQPSDVPYHPERRTPKARVKGPMLAIVTTSGEEIECDAFGCVTVQFLWDRYGKNNDKSSGPVRVLQMQSSGSVAIPRKGWEVVVECEDGDPDKPVIVGRLYNSAQCPPASLPAEKTVTAFQSFTTPNGGGHNEIRIDDAAGSELVSVHAQKDMNVVVANDRKVHVTNNSTVGIGANQTLQVGVARTEDVGANDELVVAGTQKWSVGAVRTETVSGESKLDVKGKRDATIGVSHTTLSPQAIAISTSGNLSETVGGLCLEASALETSMAVAGTFSATVGGAKIEAVAAGKTETTVGSRSVTVGGAFINASGKDVGFASKGPKSTTVGGVLLNAGGENAELSAKTDLKIKIGAALAVTGATVILKVGGSNITLSGGSAVISSKQIVLEATGPNAELAPMVSSK